MVVLVGNPVGVHLPKHPLRGHLEETAAPPGITHRVGRNLELERVAQFVCHAVHLRVLDAVGGHPEGADEVIVGASIGGTVERVRHHDHHLVVVAFRTGSREFQGVAEESVERLHLMAQVLHAEGHRLAIEQGRIGGVVAESALPHENQVVGFDRAFQTPLRGVGLQVHLAQVFWDIDFLLCVQLAHERHHHCQ